jgi:hypothetical protein
MRSARRRRSLPLFGSWYVVRAVTNDDPGAGVLYCRPADERA